METTALIESLRKLNVVDDVAAAVLAKARVGSYDDLYAFARHFPGVAANVGIPLPRVSMLAQMNVPTGVLAEIDAETAALPPATLILGALEPPAPSMPIGTVVPLSSATSPPGPALVSGVAIDARPGATWAVRDQWRRGTCVAHAVTALAEHISMKDGLIPDLSEQFLFAWAKNLDGHSGQDGTWIRYAVKALAVHGSVEEFSLRYNPEPISRADYGQTGSLANVPAAAARAPISLSNYFVPSPHVTGTAQRLYDLLAVNGTPVAVSVAVFVDPVVPDQHNWNTTDARWYGEVLDPLPTMIARGGHAVCVTGYVPDPAAAGGGWFVIRNSWSVTWGSKLPAPGHPSPEPGWGVISAEYIENNCWEMAQA